MTTRTVKNDFDLKMLTTYLAGLKRPFTVEVETGRHRSSEQNRLQRKWCKEIEEQTGEDAEDVRAYSKLHFGVPILLRDSDDFRAVYDTMIRPLAYQQKIALMRVPFDLAVTRDMKVAQKTDYLDRMFKHYSKVGIVLTIPPDRYAYDDEAAA